MSRVGSILRYFVLKVKHRRSFRASSLASLPWSTVVRLNGGGAISIGQQSAVREGTIFNVSDGGRVHLGEGVFFNDRCCVNCRSRVEIGDNVMLGQGVMIYDHDHDYRAGAIEKRDAFVCAPVRIGANVWVGSNVIILKGVTVGENSIVAAGTVLTHSVGPNTLVYTSRVLEEKSIGAA